MTAFNRNKIARFKAAKHRTISTDNQLVGLFGRSIVTEAVNNKGLRNNPRFNPDVVVIKEHVKKYMF